MVVILVVVVVVVVVVIVADSTSGNLNSLSLSLVYILYYLAAIRVDVTDRAGRTVTGLLSHEDMEQAVGDAIAAFTYELVLASAQKLVWKDLVL